MGTMRVFKHKGTGESGKSLVREVHIFHKLKVSDFKREILMYLNQGVVLAEHIKELPRGRIKKINNEKI